MRDFHNLSLKCIKGQPINDVVCRTLAEIGFPADAPPEPQETNSGYCKFWKKLSDTKYYVCGRIETEYIELLLKTKSREESFSIMLDRLSFYDITSYDLTIDLKYGCVFDITAEDAETLLDEFIYIIKVLLPSQLSDIYYSFDIEPNPAYAVFYEIAVKRLGLERYTNISQNNYHQFVSHVQDGIKERILRGETLYSIYRNTCATKEIIKKTFLEITDTQNNIGRIEVALFSLSKKYSYKPNISLSEDVSTFDFVVYENGIPVIAIDYWGEEYFNLEGNPYINETYDDMIELEQDKDKVCYNKNITHLQIDLRELDKGMCVGSLIRNILKNPSVAERHRIERREYFSFARATDDCEFNRTSFETATICGCFECCNLISPKDIVEWDYEETAICPVCGNCSIITDSQGYNLTEEFLKKINIMYSYSLPVK
ncbi:hypothetical protein [Peptostreptococcus porci]|uniref:hypothetical protein n=1 Tax=Peptostreptococcus porci TaxID=2652282 RepID=UPI002A91325B|nr:hypothetical protein [Peptostreptococcus porci]MDY5437019.1 hypothetical protein [Peptostreptococcus porci]